MEVTAEQLNQVSEKLRGCPQQVNAALTNAANRAMMTARRVAWDAVHKQYTIKKTEFYRKTSIRTYRANRQSLGAAVEFGGYVIPLINFGVESYRSHERSRIRRYLGEYQRICGMHMSRILEDTARMFLNVCLPERELHRPFTVHRQRTWSKTVRSLRK